MSSLSTEQQQEIDTRRFIFGAYARGFSSPRIQRLGDALTNLDALAACVLAVEIDNAEQKLIDEKNEIFRLEPGDVAAFKNRTYQ